MFCTAFVAISFFARRQPENHHVLLKADKLVRIAGTPPPANCASVLTASVFLTEVLFLRTAIAL